MNELTHVSLFSGIGGIDLAAEWAGFTTVAFCERDPYCQKVLHKHWPDVPICDDIYEMGVEWLSERGLIPDPQSDIRETSRHERQEPPNGCSISRRSRTTGQPTSAITLISGGFPCQPFSVAGKRRGKEDDRYLWPEMLRAIQEVRPGWVLGENVAHFFRMGLDEALSDLEGEGYETQTFSIPACAVDAPHRRERIFFVGYTRLFRPQECEKQTAGIEQPSEGGLVAHGSELRWDSQAQQKMDAEAVGRESRCGFNNCGEDVAHSGTQGLSWPICKEFGCIQGQAREQEGGQFDGAITEGWGTWPIEPNVGRVAHGVSSRVDRLKCLGNAVVPAQVYPILKAIAMIEKREAG